MSNTGCVAIIGKLLPEMRIMWGGAGQIEGLEEVRRNSTQITIPICALFEPNSCFYWGLDARLTCFLNYKVLLLGRDR